MLNPWFLIVIALAYVVVLFVIAWIGDGRRIAHSHRHIQAGIYALSLAVYCTSWTFYGAVGSAATSGWGFLAIYVGPALVFLVGIDLVRRIAVTSRDQRITSIADFIAYRYGRSHAIAVLVTLAAFVGSIPYIALQLKAITTSFHVISHSAGLPQIVEHNLSLFVALALAVFSMLFGTRTMDASEHHRGLMWAIAFESVVKLLAFLGIGLFAIFGVFGGFAEIGAALRDTPSYQQLFSPWRLPEGFGIQMVLAMTAILCLPRQFHVAVVEFRSLHELRAARWVFPLYLMLFALMVVPIALAGLQLFSGRDVNPDTYVLALPLALGSESLAVLAFLGGFSAATGMVIVATVALAIMVSNDIVMPLLLRTRLAMRSASVDLPLTLLRVRRAAILAIAVLGFMYYHAIESGVPLATIGLLSFSAAAQFAPAMLLGLYWRGASRTGAIFGLAAGMTMWFFTLLLPSLSVSVDIAFALPNLPFNTAATWSLVTNTACLVLFSWLVPDRRQSHEWALRPDESGGMITLGDLHRTLGRFLGMEDTRAALATHIGSNQLEYSALASPGTVQFGERLLAGSIGSASARTVLTTALHRRGLGPDAVMELLDRASQAVQFNRELLEATLDNLSQGVSVVDHDLRLVGWNRRYLEMMEFPDGAVYLGQPIDELIRVNAARGLLGEGDVETETRKRVIHLSSGIPYRFERKWLNGMVLEIRGNPMPGGGYVTTYTDITHFKQIERELQEINETLEHRVEQRTRELMEAISDAEQARAAAVAANQSKTRFLAAASHDLLQPMNAARLFVSILRQQQGEDGEQAQLVRRVDRSLTAAEELLSALLDISKFDSGTYQTELSVIPVTDIFEELRRRFEALATNRELQLRVRSCDRHIYSDRGLLVRILQNFLANALRYTERGGVMLAGKLQGDQLRLCVWDTGVGIEEADLASVFREFQRLDYAQRLDERGLGLGLAICDRIARTLEHPLQVKSRPGRGSCFSVTVPLATPEQIARMPARPAEVETAPRPDRLRILCVDNEQDILDGMRMLLQRWGHTVMLADGPDAALQAVIAEGSPDLVLVDYHLADQRNGLDVMQALGDALGYGLPAILITADRSTRLEEATRELGFGLLRKPIKPAALRALIGNMTKSGRAA